MSNTAQVSKMLGLTVKIETALDLVKLGQMGLPIASVSQLKESLFLNTSDLATLLVLSRRTIERYHKQREGRLSPALSERILRLALLFSQCSEVFETQENCLSWLRSENLALGGQTPLALMRSDFGIDLVKDELGRIAHGVIA